jgi:hypothetical protein
VRSLALPNPSRGLRAALGVLAPAAFALAAPAAAKPAAEPSLPEASRVKILDIGTADASYPSRTKLLGKLGVAGKGGLAGAGPGYYSGAIRLDGGVEIAFSQVSVELLLGPPAHIKGARYTGSSVAVGARVKVLEIGATDTYYADRGKIVGKLCTVTPYELYSYGAGFFSGQVFCDDGASYYFYHWAFEICWTQTVKTPSVSFCIARSISSRAGAA